MSMDLILLCIQGSHTVLKKGKGLEIEKIFFKNREKYGILTFDKNFEKSRYLVVRKNK